MAIFTGRFITLNSIILTLIDIIAYIMINKIKNHKKKNIKIEKTVEKNISIGFLLTVNNILCIICILVYYKIM